VKEKLNCPLGSQLPRRRSPTKEAAQLEPGTALTFIQRCTRPPGHLRTSVMDLDLQGKVAVIIGAAKASARPPRGHVDVSVRHQQAEGYRGPAAVHNEKERCRLVDQSLSSRNRARLITPRTLAEGRQAPAGGRRLRRRPLPSPRRVRIR
jgi:hypothetical protein